MSGFDAARRVEALAYTRLLPYIEEHASDGRLVLTEKGRLSPLLQEIAGDLIFNRAGRCWTVELKAEHKYTGNLYLETWSNKNLNDPDEHAFRGSNPGWMFKTRSDLLFYYFIDTDILYIINTFELKKWAFGISGEQGKIYRYNERCQKKYNQMNDTHGRLVPIADLAHALGKHLKRVVVSQLEIELGAA